MCHPVQSAPRPATPPPLGEVHSDDGAGVIPLPMLFCSGVYEGSEALTLRTIKPQDDLNVWIERLTSNLVLHSYPLRIIASSYQAFSARHPSQHLDSTVGLDTSSDSMDYLAAGHSLRLFDAVHCGACPSAVLCSLLGWPRRLQGDTVPADRPRVCGDWTATILLLCA